MGRMVALLARILGAGHRRHVAVLLSGALICTLVGAVLFAVVTGAAAAAGVRRILAMESRFPAGTFRLVVGMSPAVPTILDELTRAGDRVVLVADVDPAGVRAGVHVVRGDPTEFATIRAARPEAAQQALITGASDGDVLVTAVLVLGLVHDGRFVLGIGDDPVVARGDHLLIAQPAHHR